MSAISENIRGLQNGFREKAKSVANGVTEFLHHPAVKKFERVATRALIGATLLTGASLLYAPQHPLSELSFLATQTADAGDPNRSTSLNFRGWQTDLITDGDGTAHFSASGKFPRGGGTNPYDSLQGTRFNLYGGYDIIILPPENGFAQLASGEGIMRVGVVVEGDKQLGKGTIFFTSGGWHGYPDQAVGEFQTKNK